MLKDIQGFTVTQLFWIMNLRCSQLTLLVVDLYQITKYIPFRTKTQDLPFEFNCYMHIGLIYSMRFESYDMIHNI